MKISLFAIALSLSFFAYFMLNLVICNACLIPGCALASVGISLVVMVFTWTILLFTDSGLE
jgi:hypothetical protein